MNNRTHIPVIDLSAAGARGAARSNLAQALAEICHEVGFLIVTQHGVDPSLLDEVRTQAARLFALPVARKEQIDKRHSPHFRGWEAVGTEFTNGRPDIREQVDLWSEHAPRPGAGPAYWRLLGPNQWLPESELPGFRAALTRWFVELGALADELLRLLALGLELPESQFAAMFEDAPMALTKLISYPTTPPGQFGVNAHHDTGFITLLDAGVTPGLQIETAGGDWIDVPVVPGGLVVNLGEMLQAMTGNYFVATPHRVVATQPRLSTAYFHGPSLDAQLVRLPLSASRQRRVADSAWHAGAGFMARKAPAASACAGETVETEAGVEDMASAHHPATYGEQLWNYYERSYPSYVTQHYPG